MSDDDDTKTGGKHKSKFADEAQEVGKKPVTTRVWVIVAIAVVAVVLGAWLF